MHEYVENLFCRFLRTNYSRAGNTMRIRGFYFLHEYAIVFSVCRKE